MCAVIFAKGLEADYVILLQCNKDTYGFPSQVSDDPVLNYVLTKSDQFPYGEERRLFYVAITRAKVKRLYYTISVSRLYLWMNSCTRKGVKKLCKAPNANKDGQEVQTNFY